MIPRRLTESHAKTSVREQTLNLFEQAWKHENHDHISDSGKDVNDRLPANGWGFRAFVEQYVRHNVGLHLHGRWRQELAIEPANYCVLFYWAGDCFDSVD